MKRGPIYLRRDPGCVILTQRGLESRAARERELTEALEPSAPDPDLEELLQRAAVDELLAPAHLSDRERAALLLTTLREMTFEQVGHVLGLDRRTVARTVESALRKVRAVWGHESPEELESDA